MENNNKSLVSVLSQRKNNTPTHCFLIPIILSTLQSSSTTRVPSQQDMGPSQLHCEVCRKQEHIETAMGRQAKDAGCFWQSLDSSWILPTCMFYILWSHVEAAYDFLSSFKKGWHQQCTQLRSLVPTSLLYLHVPIFSHSYCTRLSLGFHLTVCPEIYDHL